MKLFLKKMILVMLLAHVSFVMSQIAPTITPTISQSIYSEMYKNQQITNAASNLVISTKTPIEKLEEQVGVFAENSMLKNADWGFCIYNPKTKKIISSYNENTGLIPASTTKLLTTEAALAILKENFTWKTQLDYSGIIDSLGTLQGNLYILGSGDPTLGTTKAGAKSRWDIVENFKYAILNTGIKKINGDIVIQNALFKSSALIAPARIVWEEYSNYYLPVGTTDDVDLKNQTLVDDKLSNLKGFVYRSPDTQKLVTTEIFTPKTSLIAKVPMIPLSLAILLRNSLAKSKIPVVGSVFTQLINNNEKSSRTYITENLSPSLKDIVYFTNQNSDNFLAESLLKTVGYYRGGDFSLEKGCISVAEELSDQGFHFDHFSLVDGSGLSRNNSISPIDQVKFLTEMMNQKHFNTYFDSLPIAGQSGTLKSMFKTSDANGNIFAKTGTLNKVKTLAGYIKTKKGETYTFSLLINNFAGSVSALKQKMEKLLNATLDL